MGCGVEMGREVKWKLVESKLVDNHDKCKAELNSNHEVVYSAPAGLVLTDCNVY